MNEFVSLNAIDNLFKLCVLATALVLFWLLESVWKNDRRWLIPIFIFPGCLFLFVVNHWEETRGKCFFAALLYVMILLISGVVGYSFFEQVLHMLKVIAFWPYYVWAYLVAA
jgi:hypothetical protein